MQMTATLDDEVNDLRRANLELQRRLDEALAERDEGEAQKAAMAEILEVINASPGELELVLQTLVETAVSICAADKAMIYRLGDGLYRTAASFGFPPEYKAFIESNPITLSRGTLTGRTAIERRAVHIEDAATDPEFT
jgi:two-component system NtrC family sensor kinase